LVWANIELVFDTRRVTIVGGYRLTRDRCHCRCPKRRADEIHLSELAREDGWVRDGKRDVRAECRAPRRTSGRCRNSRSTRLVAATAAAE